MSQLCEECRADVMLLMSCCCVVLLCRAADAVLLWRAAVLCCVNTPHACARVSQWSINQAACAKFHMRMRHREGARAPARMPAPVSASPPPPAGLRYESPHACSRLAS